MTTTTIIDATCVITATTLAGFAAVGLSPFPESFPTEQVAIGADLGAGLMAGRHALIHRLKSRKHSTTTDKPATVSICRDGRGKITWQR